MRVEVRYKNQLQFQAITRGHEILSDHHQQGLRKAVDVCIIHNTLMHPPRMTTQIAHTAPEA